MTGKEAESNPAVLDYRMRQVEEAQRSIAQSLQALVRLEQHHSDTRAGLERAWKSIEANRSRIEEVDDQIPEKLGERLGAIEEAMPNLKLTSSWVITFTLAGFGLAALLVWSLATDRHNHAYPLANERRTITEAEKRPE